MSMLVKCKRCGRLFKTDVQRDFCYDCERVK